MICEAAQKLGCTTIRLQKANCKINVAQQDFMLAFIEPAFFLTRELLPQDARYRCRAIYQRTAGQTQTVALELKRADRVMVQSYRSLLISTPSHHAFNLEGRPNVFVLTLDCPDTITSCMDGNSIAFLSVHAKVPDHYCIQVPSTYHTDSWISISSSVSSKLSSSIPTWRFPGAFPSMRAIRAPTFSRSACVDSLLVWLRYR